jgi:hypothetical protein
MIETDISFAIFRVLERKSPMNTTRKILEDPRTIIITRPGTKPTRFHNSVNYYFLESYLEVRKGKSPITIRHLTQTDRKVALEGCRRLQKTPEQRKSPEADKWGRPAPHVGWPAWSHLEVTSSFSNGLQPTSTTHLNHCFKSV